ncbi:hypothetical protein BT69DRAFT_1274986 [Atractiella rhizophila]|nr:hypothetical protein BT69DRAFT_1274986 [Atractiella rhizophila]
MTADSKQQQYSSSNMQNPTASKQELKLIAVKKEVAELEAFLGNLDPQSIVDEHIKLLHQYNECRDAAQILVGKLANFERCSVKEMYDKLGVDPDD